MCFSQFSSSRFGKSRRVCAPRLSFRSIALFVIISAQSIMYPSSMWNSRSVLNTFPLSSTPTFS